MTTATHTPAVLHETLEAPETFRQSLLAKFDNCPASAALYLKLDGGTESHPKTRGSVFHLFMQRATETMLEQGEPTMPGDMGREMADAIMAEDLSLVLSVDDQDVVRQCAWNWCEGTVLDLEALIGVEIDLELEIGGVTVTCRIDRAEVHGSSIYLADAKTSLHVRSREEAERSFQRLLYSLAILEGVRPETGLSLGAGITDVWFDFEYPRYRTEEGGIVTKGAGSTRSELSEFRFSLERNVAAFLRSLETGEWPARDGSWCSECPAQTLCPIPAHLRAVEEITTVAEAEDAFSQKMALEREGRRIQTGLRGWVAENGPIYVGDLAFDAAMTETRSVKDWDGLNEAIRKSVSFGIPFRYHDHIKLRTSTKFGRRKIHEDER